MLCQVTKLKKISSLFFYHTVFKHKGHDNVVVNMLASHFRVWFLPLPLVCVCMEFACSPMSKGFPPEYKCFALQAGLHLSQTVMCEEGYAIVPCAKPGILSRVSCDSGFHNKSRFPASQYDKQHWEWMDNCGLNNPKFHYIYEHLKSTRRTLISPWLMASDLQPWKTQSQRSVLNFYCS